MLINKIKKRTICISIIIKSWEVSVEYLKSLTNLITVKSMWYILFKIIIIVALIFIWPKLIKTINKFF